MESGLQLLHRFCGGELSHSGGDRVEQRPDHHVIRVKSGYKAEEDLLLSCGWENGSEIPKGVRVFCTIGCYEQGGAYLGANLLWDDEEQKNVITSPFSTTKP